jgi:hypothetical protein
MNNGRYFPARTPPQVFIKSELKVGVIYVKDGQYTEEEILDNNEHSPLFDEFLQIIGDKVRLKGIHHPSANICI